MKNRKSLTKKDFESLFRKALRDWPDKIRFGSLHREYPSDETYVVEDLYSLCDKAQQPYLGSTEEVLMRNMHDAIYSVLHDAAAHCSYIQLNQLRKDAVRENFELRLAPDRVSKENGWTSDDSKLVKTYFEATRRVERGKLDNLLKTADTAAKKFKIGQMYYWGDGVEKNYVAAAKWYHKASKDGHKRAQFQLGMMYERGLGVERNYQDSYFWYRISKTSFGEHVATNHLTAKQISEVEKRLRNWIAKANKVQEKAGDDTINFLHQPKQEPD